MRRRRRRARCAPRCVRSSRQSSTRGRSAESRLCSARRHAHPSEGAVRARAARRRADARCRGATEGSRMTKPLSPGAHPRRLGYRAARAHGEGRRQARRAPHTAPDRQRRRDPRAGGEDARRSALRRRRHRSWCRSSRTSAPRRASLPPKRSAGSLTSRRRRPSSRCSPPTTTRTSTCATPGASRSRESATPRRSARSRRTSPAACASPPSSRFAACGAQRWRDSLPTATRRSSSRRHARSMTTGRSRRRCRRWRGSSATSALSASRCCVAPSTPT